MCTHSVRHIFLIKEFAEEPTMEGTSTQRLGGKVAIITGGASGIGESTARLFAQHGAKLIIADLQDAKGAALVNELGAMASYMHCDVTNESDVAAAVDLAVSTHGKLDIMYCNAGITGDGTDSVTDVDGADFKKVFDVNVYGVFLGAKQAARAMIRAGGGVILFTSSIASVMGGLTPHAYTMSKHAVVGLMKGLSVELGRHGIRVNCVSPSYIATPLLRDFMGVTDRAEFEKSLQEAMVLKGRVLKEEDIAAAALFLASDEAKYVSGVNLVVDGGFTNTNLAFNIGN
ncbi:hypothetical protein V2J09_009630 [Rumex salicifolius]